MLGGASKELVVHCHCVDAHGVGEVVGCEVVNGITKVGLRLRNGNRDSDPQTTQSPMWGYPVLVLGAISSFFRVVSRVKRSGTGKWEFSIIPDS